MVTAVLQISPVMEAYGANTNMTTTAQGMGGQGMSQQQGVQYGPNTQYGSTAAANQQQGMGLPFAPTAPYGQQGVAGKMGGKDMMGPDGTYAMGKSTQGFTPYQQSIRTQQAGGYGGANAGFGQGGTAFQPLDRTGAPEPPKPRPRSREPSPRPMPRPMPRRMSSDNIYDPDAPNADYYRSRPNETCAAGGVPAPPVPRARSTPPSPKPRSRQSMTRGGTMDGHPNAMRRGTGRQAQYEADMYGQEDSLYDPNNQMQQADAQSIQKLRQQMEALSQQDFPMGATDPNARYGTGMQNTGNIPQAAQRTSPTKTAMNQYGMYGPQTAATRGYGGSTATSGYGSGESQPASRQSYASSNSYGGAGGMMQRPGIGGMDPALRRRRGSGDSATTEGCDEEVAGHMNEYHHGMPHHAGVPHNPHQQGAAMFQAGVVGVDASPQYDPASMDQHTHMCMQFMNHFVNSIFGG